MKKYKIFLVISGRATVISGSKIWINNLYDSLIRMGHEVTLFDPDEFVLTKGIKPSTLQAKEILSNELPKIFLQLHKEKKYDLFLAYLHNGRIYPEMFKEIKKHVFTINYTTNYHQFQMYKEIAKIVDLNIYISKVAKEGFDSINAKSYWMPFAANPLFYKPNKIKNNNLITFIGSPYGRRPYFLWRVLQNNINLQVYGNGWKIKNKFKSIFGYYRKILKLPFSDVNNTLSVINEMKRRKIIEKLNSDFPINIHDTLSDEAYYRILSSSSIIININESRFNHDFLNFKILLGCNLRDFETTMSGSFLLTQFSDELGYFFEDGNEVVSFKNEYELVDKLKFYSDHQKEREKIAHAGYNRAINEHTWRHRFKKFFNYFENEI